MTRPARPAATVAPSNATTPSWSGATHPCRTAAPTPTAVLSTATHVAPEEQP